jgi:hypothetical protein
MWRNKNDRRALETQTGARGIMAASLEFFVAALLE